ncbi:DNA repair protein RecO [Algoriphagus sp.]|jgi:DNA repair protein RecO (recombination protein O)|uniref:DNA repair protein RecO n=1 Tax=Algoriphagus sp. TaxID=1872435 RepID=UPI00271A1160|nr:DNA repair protein RecO [Algoriphagus sp.]MDO8966625.1 DNA repair protein RecO [Algoriphagus sp.]MDP3202151.1 DNA repair protein RecO [Algoriphagus sp.]
MIRKTSGLVLSSIRYKDTSIIVKIFTRELGLKSYLINGVRSMGKGSKMALYQPLTLLDLVVYNKENSGLQRISEAKLQRAHQRIPFDFSRTSIALFMTEVINRSIYENYQNESLYDFLSESVVILDQGETLLSHYPLVFLIEKAKFLGIAPEEAEGFILESDKQPFTNQELPLTLEYLKNLLEEKYHCAHKIPVIIRRKLLDHLLDFYAQQMENPSAFKSLAVIRQVME